MLRVPTIISSLALMLMTCSCGGGASSDPTPAPTPEQATISLSVSDSTDSSITVYAKLEGADIAYCSIGDLNAATPSLTELRTSGKRLTASSEVIFDNLTAGTTYKIFGVAGKESLYGDVISISASTSGEVDYNFPDEGVKAYITTADKKKLFAELNPREKGAGDSSLGVISLDSKTKYQTMEGFGPAITGSSAYNLLRMSDGDRDKILRAAFSPESGFGYNYIRISIGCSDFSLDEYTWCDEPGLENFAVHEYDRRDLFPILKQILEINPNVKIIAAPWSAPLWMKMPKSGSGSYDKWAGGRLNPDYYDEYAQYLVMWIQEMNRNGFEIESITPQNEPLHDGNSASTYMAWDHQRNFIRDHLGPAIQEAGLSTKIWIYDHNFDVPDFAINIYKDKETSKYIDGSAWHAYGGSYTSLSKVVNAAPDKNIYFTEQSIGTWCPNFGDNLLWHIREVCLGTFSYNCRAVVLWNFMLDINRGPNRPGGCTTCYGFVDCDGTFSYSGLTYRSHWYIIGHLSKVIERGAYRIKSTSSGTTLKSCSFENPDGTLSMVLLNDGEQSQSVVVKSSKGDFVVEAPARSVISIIW